MPANVKQFTPTQTTAAMQKLAEAYVNKCITNLQQDGHDATGRLVSSIKILPPVITGSSILIPITALEYFNYLDKGVRGTQGGAGQYSFKANMPSQQMVSSIMAWMRTKSITARTGKTTVHAMAAKQNSISSRQSLAFAIARSVLQKGITPTGFAGKAMQAVQQQMPGILGNAVAADIIELLV
ncbi:MAG TPA: hypothetical protein VHB48_10045 [Chitinophagaceae bacterium]|nr:hypothetical protein [Chitinophagaceae bacterium]